MVKIPLLQPEDIEVKIKQVSEKGAVALLYKTARTDMQILDEVFGIDGWQCDYKEIKGNLYCEIRIWDSEKKQWISKIDCGIESREDGDGNEKKGEASDAFKRAGFKVGIGRELYSAPFTFLRVETVAKGQDNRGRPRYELKNPWQKFAVSEIDYDSNRKIIKLTIVDVESGKAVYTFGQKAPQKPVKAPQKATESKGGSEVPFDSGAAFKAFKTQFSISDDAFVAMRAKAAKAGKVSDKPFKEMVPDDWRLMLEQMAKLYGEGFFDE